MDRQIKKLQKTITEYPGESLDICVQQPQMYHCESNWRWSPEPFEDFDLWVVLAGKGELRLGGESYILSPGVGFVFQPGDQVQAKHDPERPLVVFACHFLRRPVALAQSRLSRGPIRARCEVEWLGPCTELAARCDFRSETQRQLAASLIAQLVSLLLDRGLAPSPVTRDGGKLADLALAIRSKPAMEWTVPKMARQCGMSIPHFNRRFKHCFGTPPRNYVVKARIQRAIALLRESSLSLQEVADAVGYRDVFYFHRQFKQQTGRTPRTVQRENMHHFGEQ